MTLEQYHFCILGPSARDKSVALTAEVRDQVLRLGLDFDSEVQIGTGLPKHRAKLSVAIWAGRPGVFDKGELDFALAMLADGQSVFPVIDQGDPFSSSVPRELQHLNGGVWDSVERVVSQSMRSLRLVPDDRQAFISYKREDSQGVAIQLFSELALRGFRTFLDTASIPVGAEFQDSLWCRMAGADLLILLDSPNIAASQWVHDELARAHDLGLGTLQLLWPGHTRTSGTELCDLIQLQTTDFDSQHLGRTAKLTSSAVSHVVRVAESSRIRSLSLRLAHVVGDVLDIATSHGLLAEALPIGPILLKRGQKLVGRVLPVVGLPDARIVHQNEMGLIPAVSQLPARLTYNGLGASREWIQHLDWLNEREGLRSEQVDKLASWIGAL